MNHRIFVNIIVGAVVSFSSIHLASAQSNVPPSSGQKLDQISRAQSDAHPINPGPPPPQSSVVQPKIYPLHGLWICKSTVAFKPIHVSPNHSSPRIGETSRWIAIHGVYINGYAHVISFSGKPGYVNRRYIKPFYDKFAPHASCIVQGVTANGAPMYDVQ